MCGSLIGGLIGAVWNSIFQVTLMSALGAGGGADGAALAGAGGVQVVMNFVQAVIGGTVGVVIGLFISGGILHLMLMMLSSAKQPFEATFRVVAYVNGAVALFQVVPLIGPLAGMVCYFISAIVGIAEAHRISPGKAALAVFMPLIACGLVCGLGVAAIVIMAINAQG